MNRVSTWLNKEARLAQFFKEEGEECTTTRKDAVMAFIVGALIIVAIHIPQLLIGE